MKNYANKYRLHVQYISFKLKRKLRKNNLNKNKLKENHTNNNLSNLKRLYFPKEVVREDRFKDIRI